MSRGSKFRLLTCLEKKGPSMAERARTKVHRRDKSRHVASFHPCSRRHSLFLHEFHSGGLFLLSTIPSGANEPCFFRDSKGFFLLDRLIAPWLIYRISVKSNERISLFKTTKNLVRKTSQAQLLLSSRWIFIKTKIWNGGWIRVQNVAPKA